jgi:hypothetical protein
MGWWFGRILTFEVVADSAAMPVAEILSDAADGDVSSDTDHSVIGYAAYGASVRAAIEPLVSCYAIDLFDDGLQVRSPSDAGAIVLSEAILGNSADQQQTPRIQREQGPVSSVPTVLRLSYYDPARDYQSGEARASAADQSGREQGLELPAVLAADDAKSLVHQMIARRWTKRDKLTLRLPPAFFDLEPGEEIEVPLNPATWTVETCTADAFVVIAQLTPR